MRSITYSLVTIIVLALLAQFVISIYSVQQVEGSAFTGSVAVQSSATTTIVGPAIRTIFSKQASCTARVIALSDGTGTGIRFLTGDSASFVLSTTTLTNIVGLNQAGSSTVTYDGGLNGCGQWTAIASASTTVTLVEYQ